MPFHVEFEEVNLRFYVRRGDRRGVVFIREIVPRPALQLVASKFYGEPYITAPMRHEWKKGADGHAVRYEWKLGGRWHSLEAKNVTKIESHRVWQRRRVHHRTLLGLYSETRRMDFRV